MYDNWPSYLDAYLDARARNILANEFTCWSGFVSFVAENPHIWETKVTAMRNCGIAAFNNIKQALQHEMKHEIKPADEDKRFLRLLDELVARGLSLQEAVDAALKVIRANG